MHTGARLITCVVAALLISAALAEAHVTIRPREVPAKSSQEFIVRIPTEKEVPTISVRLQFPAGFQVLRFKPLPGWTYEPERDAAGTITGVTWSGGRIGREEYQEFAFIARAPEQAGVLQINAHQTYEGGEVVAWVNAAEPGPAPQVTVTAAGPAAQGSDPFAAATMNPAPATGTGGTSGTGVRAAAGAALILSAAALFLAFRAGRRTA